MNDNASSGVDKDKHMDALLEYASEQDRIGREEDSHAPNVGTIGLALRKQEERFNKAIESIGQDMAKKRKTS